MADKPEGIQWGALVGKLYNAGRGAFSWLSSGTKNVAGKATETEVGGKVVEKSSKALSTTRRATIGLAPAYVGLFLLGASIPCCAGTLRILYDGGKFAFSGDNNSTEIPTTYASDKKTLDILTDGTEVDCAEDGKCTIDGVNGGEQYRVITEPGWQTMFASDIAEANASLNDGIELLIANALILEGETTYELIDQGHVSAVTPTTKKLRSVESHTIGDGYNVFLESNGKKINLGDIPDAQLEQLAAYDELNELIGVEVDTVMRYVGTDDSVEAIDYIGIRVSGHPITQTDSGYEITTFAPEEGKEGMDRVIQLSASDLNADATSRLTYALDKGSAVCTPVIDVVLRDGKKETTGEGDAAVSRYVISGGVGNIEFKYHDMNVSKITNVEYGSTDSNEPGWFAQAQYGGQTYKLFFPEGFVRAQKTEEGFNLEDNTAVSGLAFSTGYHVTSTDHNVEQTYFVVYGAGIGEASAPIEPDNGSRVSTNSNGNRSPAAPAARKKPSKRRPSQRR